QHHLDRSPSRELQPDGGGDERRGADDHLSCGGDHREYRCGADVLHPSRSSEHAEGGVAARFDRGAPLRHHPRSPLKKEQQMLKKLCLLGAAVGALSSAAAIAQTPEVTLTRLDCGTGFNDQRRFSDTFAYTDPKVPFTFSCYVIKHGSDYMVWDTGYAPGSTPSANNKPLTDLLAQMHVKPEEVKYVGI